MTEADTLVLVEETLARHAGGRESLIPVLQDLQDRCGYLSEPAIEALSRMARISENEIYGVASFYTQFRFDPPAEHTIRVCQGTACHVRGGLQILHDFEERLDVKAGGQTKDGKFGVERVACVGCCALAPVVVIDGKVHPRMEAKVVKRHLARLQADETTGRSTTAQEDEAAALLPSLADRVLAGPTGPIQEAYAGACDGWERLQESTTPVFFVGAATCGRAAGALETIARLRAEIASRNLDAQVIETGCLGPCSFEPLVIVHKPGAPKVCYAEVNASRAAVILERHVLGDDPCSEWALGTLGDHPLDGIAPLTEHPMMRGQVRRVLSNCGVIDPGDLGHYLARDGYRGFLKALEMGPLEVLEEVKRSGLKGRGGAGFPVWRKWTFCRDTPADQRYLICNADEGDPGAFMDRSLIEGDPHAVLEGMLIEAFALGASKGYVYCRAEYPLALERLETAIAQMRKASLLGEDICGSGFCFDVSIKMGAGAFVCGEETALIASMEGRRGMPQPRPPFPAVSGLWGKPTVIQNVETLGNLPIILRKGGDWYAEVGTESSKGSKTFALAGKVNRTGLIEVPLGMTLKEIVESIGGGCPDGKEIKAVQTGGPSGGCIPKEMLDLPVDYASLGKAGSIMGSGGLIVLDEDTCIVDLARYFLSFTQAESCGKCPPCRVGTKAMLYLLERIVEGKGEERDLQKLMDLAKTVHAGSLCGLGQTAPNPVLTTLRYFRSEYEDHVLHKQCRAFVCRPLVRYVIDEERCTGCTACALACPCDVISGEKGELHIIDQELCSGCGACFSACPATFAAVVRKSGGLERREPIRKRAPRKKKDRSAATHS